jgi:hypothetical protein
MSLNQDNRDFASQNNNVYEISFMYNTFSVSMSDTIVQRGLNISGDGHNPV